MDVEIISVGTELLLGDITNTNAQYLARELSILGFSSYHQVVIGDNPKRMETTIVQALSRSDIIIITGGLGPTYDDVTKEIVAKVTKRPLSLNPVALENVQRFFEVRRLKMPKNNLKQAMIPDGSVVLYNHQGTAPGILLEFNQNIIILLPGPPFEMRWMFEHEVKKHLEKLQNEKIVSKHLYLFGIGESHFEDETKEWMENQINPSIAPYAHNGLLMIRITAKASSSSEANQLIEPILNKLCEDYQDFFVGVEEINSLEKAVVSALKKTKQTIAVAESCSSGLLASSITKVSGSSEVFHLGMVTYSNLMKEKYLDVQSHTLQKYGAISKLTALEMAHNIRLKAQSDFGLSITGNAGPKASEDKEVGLVYIALSSKEQDIVHEFHLSRKRKSERNTLRKMATNHALKILLDELRKK